MQRMRGQSQAADSTSTEDVTMSKTEYPHYFRHCPYDYIDVYRVLALFGVTDPCFQHAIKKLLAAGQRGSKDTAKDVTEVIATLRRWEAMRREEAETTKNDDPVHAEIESMSQIGLTQPRPTTVIAPAPWPFSGAASSSYGGTE